MRNFRLLLALVAAALSQPISASAQSAESPFEFHAARNTAVGRARDLPVVGIPTYATWDYRTAMLQFRYKDSDHDQFVLQLLNRRLGSSPLQAAIPDVAMQWAFWQRRGSWGALKVGRAPMPRGIFNEIRFVGTVLPFFRPSFEIYGEGRETVDGVVFARRQQLGNGFSVDVNAFAGSNEVRTQVITASGNCIRAFRGNNLKGVQGWLNLCVGEVASVRSSPIITSTATLHAVRAAKFSTRPKRASFRRPSCAVRRCASTASARRRTARATPPKPSSASPTSSICRDKTA